MFHGKPDFVYFMTVFQGINFTIVLKLSLRRLFWALHFILIRFSPLIYNLKPQVFVVAEQAQG